MRIIDQGYRMLTSVESLNEQVRQIETCARLSYKSESHITDDSAKNFIKERIAAGHEAVIEMSSMVVIFMTDRGVSHELVRHRLCSFVQESTRYCNYSKGKFSGEITVVRPVWIPASLEASESDPLFTQTNIDNWLTSMKQAEEAYLAAIECGGWKPQQARAMLPNSLKTEIAVGTNFREWRHIFQLRAISSAAHPQMRDLMIPLYEECRTILPEVFDMGDPA